MACDFSKEGTLEGTYERIASHCAHLDVSVVVNNVGVDVLGRFGDLPLADVKKVLDVNCYPVSLLCHQFIPRLLRRKKRSAIVIVSSLAGEFPMAMHNIYSASKAFTDYLSRTFSYEYPSIDFLSLRPSEV